MSSLAKRLYDLSADLRELQRDAETKYSNEKVSRENIHKLDRAADDLAGWLYARHCQ